MGRTYPNRSKCEQTSTQTFPRYKKTHVKIQATERTQKDIRMLSSHVHVQTNGCTHTGNTVIGRRRDTERTHALLGH